MILSYTLDEPTCRIGAIRNYDHRLRILRIVRPTLGLLLILLGLLYVTLQPPGVGLLGILMFPIGLFLLVQKHFVVWMGAKASFKGHNRDNFECVLKAGDDGIELKTDFGHATSTWDGFIDSRVFVDGVLLYPQRRIYYWIPRTARIEDGTWSDFCELVKRQVTGESRQRS